jgi:hypothetical protein
MGIISIIKEGSSKLRFGGTRMALLFSALLVLPLVAFTASASAYSCASNALCVYKNTGGGGSTTSWGGDWHNECWNMIPAWNDIISSVDNNLPVNVTFYDNSNCKASAPAWQFTVNAGQQASSGDSIFPWWMNDQISSVYFH